MARLSPWPLLVVALLTTKSASAEDEGFSLLAEPTSYTDVIDAFDGSDPFDLNVDVGFLRSNSRATIRREVPGEPGRLARVADSELTTNTLLLGLDVGLFHDVMVFARLPLVLSETHDLRFPQGSRCPNCGAQKDDVRALLAGTLGQPLFLPGNASGSKTRSGVPHVDLGAAWAVTNQHRSAGRPTWAVVLTGRIASPDVRSGCVSGMDCDPGISRGVNSLRVESRWSYRYRHAEPYIGLGYEASWAGSGQRRFRERKGDEDASPPDRADITAGVAVIPWEDRGRFQRFTVDLRGVGTHLTTGREFTPLFDALGSSDAAELRIEDAPFSGLTRAAGHARFGLSASVIMQAARYVRFVVGLRLTQQSAHLISGEFPGPSYRPVLDEPGQRFRIEDASTIDLSATARGQF